MAGDGVYLSYDGADWSEFRGELAVAKDALRGTTKESVLRAAQIVKDRAVEIAAEYSKKIPPTIKLIPGDGKAVIEAGAGVPLAGLYEMGNRTRGGSTSTHGGHLAFKHPTFGHSPWDWQERHPFLSVAEYEETHSIGLAMDAATSAGLDAIKLGDVEQR